MCETFNHREHRETLSCNPEPAFFAGPGFQKSAPLWLIVFICLNLISCAKRPDAGTLVVVIESSPANLDPRIGKDAQSERIDELIFDSLVRKDEHFNITPGVADHWETPDPQTYIFHLHHGIHFHDGR